MLPQTRMSLFWIVTFLCPPEAGVNNGARDGSHFPSLSHKSHLVVKMEVQVPKKRPSALTEEQLK